MRRHPFFLGLVCGFVPFLFAFPTRLAQIAFLLISCDRILFSKLSRHCRVDFYFREASAPLFSSAPTSLSRNACARRRRAATRGRNWRVEGRNRGSRFGHFSLRLLLFFLYNKSTSFVLLSNWYGFSKAPSPPLSSLPPPEPHA